MATADTPTVECTGPGVRGALVEYAPDQVGRFEDELRAALSRAHEDLDLTAPSSVVLRWWRVARARAASLSACEREAVHRARDGDESALWVRSGDGWARP